MENNMPTYKVEVVDDDSTWGVRVKIDKAKKPAFSVDGLESYSAAVFAGQSFVLSQIKENNPRQWGMFTEPDPRIVALAQQEALANSSSNGSSGGESQEVIEEVPAE